ncbi:MAG: WG repeat-containing protein, partial [Cyclobacteriaceae bacterium]|nr:WG repeat-containing protein [Cyclobacteriaceae bacterium]
ASRGIVYVRSGNSYRYGLIDLHNRPVIPIEYNQIQFLGNLRYAVQDTSGRFALFNENGKALTGFLFDDITQFRNNYAVVYQNGYQGIIDRNGLLRINPSFTTIQLEDNGEARGRKQNQWTILDGRNNTLQTIQYDSIFALGDDRFGIRKGAGIVVTNNNFRELTPTRFNTIGTFENHRAIVTLNGRQGLIDNKGEYIVPAEYRALRQGENHIFAQLQDGRWIMLDTTGKRRSQL